MCKSSINLDQLESADIENLDTFPISVALYQNDIDILGLYELVFNDFMPMWKLDLYNSSSSLIENLSSHTPNIVMTHWHGYPNVNDIAQFIPKLIEKRGTKITPFLVGLYNGSLDSDSCYSIKMKQVIELFDVAHLSVGLTTKFPSTIMSELGNFILQKQMKSITEYSPCN